MELVSYMKGRGQETKSDRECEKGKRLIIFRELPITSARTGLSKKRAWI